MVKNTKIKCLTVVKARKTKQMSEEIKKCIVSIDVGVKNLAICVLTEGISGTINVLYWNLINVVDVSQNDEDMETLMSSGDYQVTVDKKIRKPRRKKEDMPEKPLKGVCINVIRKTGKPCGKAGTINARGKAYCGTHDPSKKHKPQDTQEWCYAMLLSLPKIGKDINDILLKTNCVDKTEVIIEQQSMDNKKILLQGHLIFGHFVMLFNNKVPVRFVPAYNKLLAYDGPDIACALKTPYAKRKFLARKHTEYYLKKFPTMNKWKGMFDSNVSKQDDLADSFLQGLYVMKGAGKAVSEGNSGATSKPRRRRKIRF